MMSGILLRPATFLLAAYMAGIWLADRVPGHAAFAMAVMGSGVLGLLICFRRKNTLAVILAVLMLGGGYLAMVPRVAPDFPPHHVYHRADGEKQAFIAAVADYPRRGPNTLRFIVEATALSTGENVLPLCGRIRVTVPLSGKAPVPDVETGDRLRICAKLKIPSNFQNPGAFDYRRYLAHKNIFVTAWVRPENLIILARPGPAELSAKIAHIRRRLGRFIEANVPSLQARVLKALLIGDRGGLDPELREPFVCAGIGHLLAISGLHVGIIAFLGFWGLRRLFLCFPFFLWRAWSVKAAALGAFVPVVTYGCLAGWSPSTQRAVIMVGVFLAAVLFERQHDALSTLALAALIILVMDPAALFAISFQLSFLAVLAILGGFGRIDPRHLFDAPDTGRTIGSRALVFVLSSLAASLWAILGTLPLVMRGFNQISLIGVMSNLWAIPVIGFAVVPLGLAAIFCYLFSPDVAAFILQVAGHLLGPCLDLVFWSGGLPLAAIRTFIPSTVEILAWYAFGWALLYPALGRHLRWVLICMLVFLTLDTGYWLNQRFWHQDLRVTILDVKQGSASLVEIPGGGCLLIDGGGFSDNSVFDVGRLVVAPYLLRHKILSVDTLVLSHANSDHINGLLFIADQFKVKTVWTNGEKATTAAFQDFLAIIDKRQIKMPDLGTLLSGTVFNGVRIKCLYPPQDFLKRRPSEPWRDLNNNSLVVRIRFGQVSFLFPGDIMYRAELELARLAGSQLRSTVLVAPHHGSRSSSTAEFIEAAAPQLVVFSLGPKNMFGFPHESVLKRYKHQGCRILRTDQDGAVALTTKGKTLDVRCALTPCSVRIRP